jgi:hypothetical protein
MHNFAALIRVFAGRVFLRLWQACHTNRQQALTVLLLMLMIMLTWIAMDASLVFRGLLSCLSVLVVTFIANLIDPIPCADSEATK